MAKLMRMRSIAEDSQSMTYEKFSIGDSEDENAEYTLRFTDDGQRKKKAIVGCAVILLLTTICIISLCLTSQTKQGAGGECKTTNGNPCIFPFKDGNEEYNECKNEGGKYFWCATSVYDSGKYKHWSYCPEDRSCPLEGDGECRATNNKPCVFPFKDGEKEYNECADQGGQYFWCATGTNSAGKYTAWSKCPNDGSCPLPQKETTPVMTSTATTAVTTPPTNGTSAAAIAIANIENTLNEINDTLQNLETAGFSEDEKQLLETMNELSDYLETSSLTRSWNYNPVKINSWTQQLYTTTASIKASKEVNPGFISAFQTTETKCSKAAQKAKLSQVNAGPGRMFQLHTISEILGIITNAPSSSVCCEECKALAADTELFEHSSYQKQCDCYKTKSGVPPQTMGSANLDSGVCADKGKEEKLILVCPDGYSEKSNAPSLYLLKDWTYNDNAEDVYVSANACATECKKNTKCDAVVSTVCMGCQLLTKEDSAHTPREKVNNYCLYEALTGSKSLTQTRNNDCPTGYKDEKNSPIASFSTMKYAITKVATLDKCKESCDNEELCKGFYWFKKSIKQCGKKPTTSKVEACVLVIALKESLETLANYDQLENEKLYQNSEWLICIKAPLDLCNSNWLEKNQGFRMKADSRMIGAAEEEDWKNWPWAASLSLHGIAKSVLCGGVLISCQHILTAQHCVMDEDKEDQDVYIDPANIEISLGSLEVHGGMIYKGRDIYYKTHNQALNDIAIIKMNKKIETTDGIRPILLSTIPTINYEKSNNDDKIRSDRLHVVGWGSYKEDGAISKILRVTNKLKIREKDACKKIFLPPTSMCIQMFKGDLKTGDAVCRGDSGSPGMVEEDGKWYVQAVVQTTIVPEVGAPEKDPLECFRGGFGTFADVPQYSEIKKIVDTDDPASGQWKKWICKMGLHQCTEECQCKHPLASTMPTSQQILCQEGETCNPYQIDFPIIKTPTCTLYCKKNGKGEEKDCWCWITTNGKIQKTRECIEGVTCMEDGKCILEL